MNTTNTETEENLKTAFSYYNAMCTKDFNKVASFLSEDVCLTSPLAKISGKKYVFNAATRFAEMLKDIHISSSFSTNDQVMLAYDMIVPEPIGKFRAAALMDIKNNKITRIELFYDARGFEVKKDDIFVNSNN